MLSQYTLTFQTECPTPRQEWAYPLYASLLERLPASVGVRQHDGERTGVSQFVRCVGDGRLVWQVSLLGEEAEEIFAPILEEMDCCTLRREHATLRLQQRRVLRISAVEELLSRPYPARRLLAPGAAVQHAGGIRGLPDTQSGRNLPPALPAEPEQRPALLPQRAAGGAGAAGRHHPGEAPAAPPLRGTPGRHQPEQHPHGVPQ